MTELIVTVNAPGEVAGWLLPLAQHVKRSDPAVRIRAVLTPCPFAGGREREILSAHPALDDVVDLRPFLFDLVRRRQPRRQALVLHLGGDRIYSLLIAKLLRAPAWVYGTSRQWSRWYQRCLVPDARTIDKLRRAGVASDRIAAVGEMVVDSVPETVDGIGALRAFGIDPEREEPVTLMAGSRPYEVEFMLPFYADVIDALASSRPSARCLLPFSEFVDPALIDRAMERAGMRTERGAGDSVCVRTRRGATARIVHKERYAAMAASRMVVTLPGTNTLQLAALGAPMLVVVPLNRVENAVVEGPVNWLSTRWWPTRALKRRLLLHVNERLGFIALPNMLAGREVVPELRAMLEPADVAGQIVRWLDDCEGRAAMSRELRRLAGPRGAAARMAAEVTRRRREPAGAGATSVAAERQ
jgi:lipid-A-disaccharide synthase